MRFARFFFLSSGKEKKKGKITIFTLLMIFLFSYFNLETYFKIIVCVGIKSELQIVTFYKSNEKHVIVPVGDTGAHMLSLGSCPSCASSLYLQTAAELVEADTVLKMKGRRGILFSFYSQMRGYVVNDFTDPSLVLHQNHFIAQVNTLYTNTIVTRAHQLWIRGFANPSSQLLFSRIQDKPDCWEVGEGPVQRRGEQFSLKSTKIALCWMKLGMRVLCLSLRTSAFFLRISKKEIHDTVFSTRPVVF